MGGRICEIKYKYTIEINVKYEYCNVTFASSSWTWNLENQINKNQWKHPYPIYTLKLSFPFTTQHITTLLPLRTNRVATNAVHCIRLVILTNHCSPRALSEIICLPGCDVITELRLLLPAYMRRCSLSCGFEFPATAVEIQWSPSL
jgi:hypothetical protein